MQIRLRSILGIGSLILAQFNLSAQQAPPIPFEVFAGNNFLFSQVSVSRSFIPESKVKFFGLAAYSTDYQNNLDDRNMVMINQVSYDLKKGFGFLTGLNMNTAIGVAPEAGVKHLFASPAYLAVTILSFNIHASTNLLGIYEYKPALSQNWAMYNRLQFLYNTGLSDWSHNRSYAYLRVGLTKDDLSFGLAVNLDRFGPEMEFKDNYGLLARWAFQ
jgi:hypothetical protein